MGMKISNVFNDKKFAEQTGLTFDSIEGLHQGTYAGYPVCVKHDYQKNYLVFDLYAKPAENYDIDLSQWYERWQMEHTGISQISFTGKRLQARIAFSKGDQTADAIFLFAQLAESAAQHRLIPCCGSCGTEYGYEMYSFNGAGICLCPECSEKLQLTAAANEAVMSSKKANPLGILLGTLIGALVLFAMTYGLYQLGYIAYITGYVGVLVSLLCIKKFSGKLSLGGALFSMAVCLVVAVATPVFCIANDYAKAYSDEMTEMAPLASEYEEVRQMLNEMTPEEFDTYFDGEVTYTEIKESVEFYDEVRTHSTVQECLSDFKSLVSGEDGKKARGELIKEILWGVCSILIGAALTIPGMLGADNGKFSFRKMGE